MNSTKQRFLFLLLAGVLSIMNVSAQKKNDDAKLYEMRIYYCEPGRLDALLARFRDHTTKLFEKHGMTNVGYWVPVENTDNKLVYVLSYPGDKAYRDKAWKEFINDPVWKKAQSDSEKDGKIVAKVESVFMKETDFSFPMTVSGPADNRIFEMRTYHTVPGKLPDLLARFRNHTTALFAKQGMTNLNYWLPVEKDNLLIYMLAHKNADAAKSSFDAFRVDPDWIKARDNSERNGKIVEKVEFVYMKATDFSAIK
ncbi:NIPSNAP family protein [Arundinibacter roseus]|uniref:NIPSNAP family protein n=1 Tax=Arundinibacter roseus TaxID=2070510 RepID=A0A4R4KDN2_9BACT|nr:NIPSNAP family protein [Arundinibacter roseus]TDB66047.1 NIPSNAP family protein [Arundinibacter roseus]